jgi:hypothetical protein
VDRYDSDPLSLPAALDGRRRFGRADLEFHDVDHSGLSYEGRVFVEPHPAAEDRRPVDESTAFDDGRYAGSFYVFGHWGCVGDEGHCEVPSGPLHAFDHRPPHKLTPIKLSVEITGALERLVEDPDVGEFTVHVIPHPAPLTPDDDTSDLLRFGRLSLLTYDGEGDPAA